MEFKSRLGVVAPPPGKTREENIFSMALMHEETFGPAIGIARVSNESEGIALMNDSDFGLTASIWSGDFERASRLAEDVEAGTVFANRCDYLDPALAWTGVKDSGRGCTLSRVGFESLTRPKSFHLRTVVENNH